MTKAFKSSLKSASFVVLAIGLVASFQASAKSSKTLNAVTQKYRDSKMVEMSADKIIKSELLGKETTYKGKISLSGGKFRWENSTPEETLLVFDGSNIWSVQHPPKEFGGKPQVAHSKVNKKTKSQILISSLLGKEPVDKNFKVLEEKTKGDIVVVKVAPQGGDLAVKSLDLTLNSKSKTLDEVSYLDDVGNLTTMKFENIKFLPKEDKKRFQYQPPEGVEVNEL